MLWFRFPRTPPPQLGFQLMGTVDATLLGRHADISLAAAGVGNNLLFAITAHRGAGPRRS